LAAVQVPKPPTELSCAHDVPQAPQFCGEVDRLTHLPEDVPASLAHSVSGGVQEATHPVDEHKPVGAAH
jgi:hypothetical protein